MVGNTLMDAPDVLKKIAAYKVNEVAQLKDEISIEDLREIARSQVPPRGFTKALQTAPKTALICEVKKASPSKGIIRKLRKDFMLDPIQITESRAMGADCILVILAMINDDIARALIAEAVELGMDALIETHNAAEMARAVNLGATLIGINNRDLRTFETSLDTFKHLAPDAPENATLVAESGIFTRAHIRTLTTQGAQGFLIGESLMRQDDVEIAVRALLD